MFITAFSDPGIIPRVDNLANDRDLEMIPIDRSKEKKDGFTLADSSGLTMNYKVCDTCGIYKDKDRKHCRVCDNCVSGFDHHCNNIFFIYTLFFTIWNLDYIPLDLRSNKSQSMKKVNIDWQKNPLIIETFDFNKQSCFLPKVCHFGDSNL